MTDQSSGPFQKRLNLSQMSRESMVWPEHWPLWISSVTKQSGGEASKPEEVWQTKMIVNNLGQGRGSGKGRRGSGCSDTPPDSPRGQDSRGNMLFALVHADENVVLKDIAADFRSQKPGAGLIWMESKEQAAQL